MTYGDFKDLARKTAFAKVLRDKAFNITKNSRYDGYHRGLASMVYKFFDKKSKGKGVNIPSKFSKLLAEKLHEPIVRNFKKKNSLCRFKDTILGANLADIQLINKFNKGFRVLLCVINFFSEYDWAVPLKDNKGVSIVVAFQKMLDKSGCKSNKIWVDKGSQL